MPPSKKETLPHTLAERIRFLREKRFLTPAALALRAQVPLKTIEDIEAGIELFLAPSLRQRLSKILQVRPADIRDVEKPPSVPFSEIAAMQEKSKILHEDIMADPDGEHVCPCCGASMLVRMFERRDLHNRPFLAMKANCTQCLFRLEDD